MSDIDEAPRQTIRHSPRRPDGEGQSRRAVWRRKKLAAAEAAARGQPLAPHEVSVLRWIAAGPLPLQRISSAVVRRLDELGCIEIVPLPSPFRAGGIIDHARILPAGHDLLKELRRCQAN